MSDTNNNEETTTTTAGELVGQKLQSAEEVYVYKIPPLKTAGGHRAEDWNLANPLKTCSLLVEQHGDKLHLLFRFLQNPESDPNSWALFACSKIDLKRDGKLLSLEYFVENVVDSSRYFVVRIIDERSGREAHIGFGFRDRDEATDFRESLQYYVRSIKREEEGQDSMHHQYDGLGEKLKLADGEKIHINLPGGGGSTKTKQAKDDNKKKSSGGGGGPFLLKKPPPAPSVEKDVSISFGDIDINAGSKTKEGGGGGGGIEESSTAALGEISSAGEDDFGDDEDWQDFEGATT